ncbi:extracellular solute-binding protein [Pseudomonas caspiana]|uniref:extracellular solute-binding protein n=1 Tax=Pseudomonas caspiana TaxID=1451454 RepID=UPI0032EEB677
MIRAFILSAPFLVNIFVCQASPKAVEFWYGHSDASARVISELCNRFNESRNDDSGITCIHQGSYEQVLQKTVAAYRAGQSPALAEIYDAATADMLLGGATWDVETLMAAYGKQYAAGTFVPALRRYYSNSNGLIAAQPFAASTAIMYSHRNMLAFAGVDEPPNTWEAFEAALKSLKEKGIKCPFVTDFTPWIWLEQASAAQGSLVASQVNGTAGLNARYLFNKGSHPQLMSDLARWTKFRWVKDQAATRTGLQTQAFASGECAMLLDSTAAWRTIREADMTDMEFTVLPVYAGTQRHASVPGGTALWVLRGHNNKDYAVVAAFLAFLLRPENQLYFSQQTGYLPVTSDATNQMLRTLYEPTPVSMGLASLMDGHGQVSPALRSGFMTRLRLIWQQQMQNALTGRQTTDEALQNTVTRGNSLLALFEETYGEFPRY